MSFSIYFITLYVYKRHVCEELYSLDTLLIHRSSFACLPYKLRAYKVYGRIIIKYSSLCVEYLAPKLNKEDG
jgi:hypothetical protein